MQIRKFRQWKRRPLLSDYLVVAMLFIIALGGCAKPESKAQQTIVAKEDTSKMVKVGSEKIEKLLGHEQAIALRNMLGGARGIFIAPYMTGAAAIIGVEDGTGYLMRRHEQDWSDPVFMKLSEYSLGYQGGAKESHMLILLMTDKAVDNFVAGKMELGGKGGFAAGNFGLGASGAGGVYGGLELLIVTTNQGLFLGGGMTDIAPKPATQINEDIYGKNPDLKAILAGPGGKYAPAIPVRAALSTMVVKAWADPGH